MEGVCRKSGEGGAVKVEKRIESNIDEERFKEGIVLKENILDSAKKKMGEVRNENQILKRHLTQIMKDYQTLQMQFNDIIGQEAKESTRSKPYAYNQEIDEEPEELVSLSLGRRSREPEKYDTMDSRRKENEQDEEGQSVGLDSKFRLSTETSMKQSPEKEDARQSWSQNKVLKTTRSDDELEVTEPKPSKRARVSVRVRSNAPTMNDGGQWRKYGQKIAKGNPCPRAYYRCTIAPSCPVRKQVQRSADDMSVLITTYEGTHNHPLPISATAMASTTSAAASMLLSGPSSSSSGTILNPSTSNTTNSALLYLSSNSKPKQYYLPHSSISSSPLHPTISLDFTSTSSSSHLFSNAGSSSTNLNFGCLESNPLPFSLNFGRQPQGNYFQSFMQKPSPNYPPQQTLPLDTITAATKAITSDQKFQSALAIALASIISNR